jgi:high-affinity Fe2+/Pb2+ permease
MGTMTAFVLGLLIGAAAVGLAWWGWHRRSERSQQLAAQLRAAVEKKPGGQGQ